MSGWTDKEKAIADALLERYYVKEISFEESIEIAESCGINKWNYKSYAFDESIRSYNENFKKYIGKIKEEALEYESRLSEEDMRVLEENPENISIEKTIRDNLQRKHDIYEINLAKHYFRIAIDMMKAGYDDDYIKENVPLTNEAINEIREDFSKLLKNSKSI